MTKVEEGLFTDYYLKVAGSFSELGVREEENKIRVPEKVIRCIWNDQLFKPVPLLTVTGETIEIESPGFWNFVSSGPDFSSARIRINGKALTGDVELHVHSVDWDRHQHGKNPDYDNVVLHVFMWKSKGTNKELNREGTKPVYELELKNYLEKGILELTESLDFDSYPIFNEFNFGLCHDPINKLTEDKLSHLLDSAGEARILSKMDRFHDRVIIDGYEQTFYEGVAEALGYPSNKKSFQTLASTVTLAKLKELLPEEVDQTEKAVHAQAILFGVSGLFPFKSLKKEEISSKDKKYFEKLSNLWRKYEQKIEISPLSREIWKFKGNRPANYPYRRIAALANLVVRHIEQGMFEDFLALFKSAISKGEKKGYNNRLFKPFFEFFCVDSPEYWDLHYTPGGKELSSVQKPVGISRSREITVNMAIPLGLIYARASKSEVLEYALKVLYESGNKPVDNKSIRFMKRFVLGDNKRLLGLLKTDKQTQGLMQVFQDYCAQNKNNCSQCRFPDVVKRHFS